MKLYLPLLTVVALTALVAGCNQSTTETWQQTKQSTTNAWANAKDSAQSAADYTYDKKDAFVAQCRADLDALDKKIQEWSDKAASAADSAKADAQAKLQDLRAQRATLNDKYAAVKGSSASTWNDVKSGFNDAYDSTTNSLSQAWQWINGKLGS